MERKFIVTVESVNDNKSKKNGWNDDLVKQFARVYTGSRDYWEYMNHKTIEKKLEHFKKVNKIGD